MDAPRGIRPLWRIPGIVLRERAHPPGRVRVPEPMVMDDPESVAHFHEGGLQNPGMQAVYDFGARAVDALLPLNGRLLDLGVGSGRALSAIVLAIGVLSVSSIMFVIVDLSLPYQGVFHVPSAAMREALADMLR